MIRTPLLCLLSLAGLLALAAHAPAQRRVKVPAPKADDPDPAFLVRVTAPRTRCFSVSDRLGLLAVGHAASKDAQVSLFRLDGEGRPRPDPVTLTLPRPEALAKTPAGVLSVAFHPTRPLLYVWQDLELPRRPDNQLLPLGPTEESALGLFDHLFLFRVDGEKPQLLCSLCRGAAFAHGRPQGSICPDATNGRLYIPNLHGHPKTNQVIVGSYVLDPEGIPLVGKVLAEPEAKEGPFDPKAAETAARVISDALKTGNPVLPQRTAPTTGDLFPDLWCGAGLGFIPLARDVVLFGSYHDIALGFWAPESRIRVGGYMPHSGYLHYYPTLHPKLPVIYIAGLGGQYVYRLEHVDGHLTLTPQVVLLEGVNVQSPPVVLPKINKLAVGGYQRLHLVSLDDQGKIRPERTQVLIGNQAVSALAYSAKFDRLYVGVEKEKEKGK